MKSVIRTLIPGFIIEAYGWFRRNRRLNDQQRNRHKTVEEVFTDIYKDNRWGGSKGEFCSGSGSTDDRIVSAYVAMVSEKASSEGFKGLAFVDLGCGDFRVGRELLPLCSEYIGVDVVEPLIRRNQQVYGNEKTRFAHLNILEEELPDGDVCFVRQVLQHLSNDQIGMVLEKLKKYRWVFVTEHYPTDNDRITPNIDKVHGAEIRLHFNSGVYLSEPPFDVPEHMVADVLEVPRGSRDKGNDPGVVRTCLYKPER